MNMHVIPGPTTHCTPTRGWVLYDEACAFCTRWVRFWRGTLEQRGYAIASLQTPWVMERLKMEPKELLRDIRLLTAEGRLVEGADVYLHVMRRIWWAWPLYVLFSLPVLNRAFWIGYRLFAANRYLLGLSCEKPQQGCEADDTARPAFARSRFQGVLQFLRIHAPLYAFIFAAIACGVVLLLVLPLPAVWRVVIALGLAIAALWTFGSVLAAHHIYDRSELYRWAWLPARLRTFPRKWLNIHVGLDEASLDIAGLFPSAQGKALDVFSPDLMKASALLRARKRALSFYRSAEADYARLPLADASCDTCFLIFAAHEFRAAEDRRKLFEEVHRVLAPGGTLVLVEHLRDAMNFLAFGPGFLHVYPRRVWKNLLGDTGFEADNEFSLTPFVRVFLETKPERAPKKRRRVRQNSGWFDGTLLIG